MACGKTSLLQKQHLCQKDAERLDEVDMLEVENADYDCTILVRSTIFLDLHPGWSMCDLGLQSRRLSPLSLPTDRVPLFQRQMGRLPRPRLTSGAGSSTFSA